MKYTEFGSWLQKETGHKTQKISVNAGLGCPNRDGTLGTGGCAFCRNEAFSPAYALHGKSVSEQLATGKSFFSRKYPHMKYLAYFQSYTGTHGSLSKLKALYEEALSVPDIVGLVVATRPDCMPKELLEYFAKLNKETFLLVEYGIESANNDTLRKINRGHTFQQTQETIKRTADEGIRVGGHVILGFPWEGHDELMRQAEEIGTLPLTTLKLHQLQILRDTPLARLYETNPWHMPSAEEYIRLVLEYISHLPKGLVLERFVSQSPPELVVAPQWGLKNHEFAEMVRSVDAKNINYK